MAIQYLLTLNNSFVFAQIISWHYFTCTHSMCVGSSHTLVPLLLSDSSLGTLPCHLFISSSVYSLWLFFICIQGDLSWSAPCWMFLTRTVHSSARGIILDLSELMLEPQCLVPSKSQHKCIFQQPALVGTGLFHRQLVNFPLKSFSSKQLAKTCFVWNCVISKVFLSLILFLLCWSAGSCCSFGIWNPSCFHRVPAVVLPAGFVSTLYSTVTSDARSQGLNLQGLY